MSMLHESPEAHLVLRDGSSISIRPAVAADADAILAFLRGLAPASLHQRFPVAVDLAEVARHWSDGGCDGCSLLAIAGIEGRVVAHAGFVRQARDAAEVAFVVADDFQGRGVGTLLLLRLAQAAQAAGITTFQASVAPENHRMIEVFRESGFPVTMRSEPGLIRVEFPTELTDEARERFDHREQVAAVNAVRGILAPRSVAVIGASRGRGSIGGEVFRNLLEGNFNGPVYPVNPSADVVQCVKAYPSILDVPDEVDLAVVVVPARVALDTVRDCARKGVKGLVVITAGFGETGAAGRRLERELLAICREAGMRLVGPNCMGVMNTADGTRLDATFSPNAALPGNVGFLSQSGALGLACIEYANSLGLGLSTFISVGNKADLSDADFLDYWEADEGTDVVALYLESVGNPRKFARTARRVGRSKPILAVKSGRSTAGARATSSHTGALLGASDVTVDALFRQAGVIRTDTLGEFFDVASLLANQPMPRGKRVAILTNGGGPGILCADACEANGLVVPQTPEQLKATLAEFLPPEAGLNNPIDMIAAAPDTSYERALRLLAEWDGIDAVIVIYVPVLVTTAEQIGAAVRRAALDWPAPSKPLLAVFMTSKGAPADLKRDGLNLPSYLFPEDAARALAQAVRYGEWRTAPLGSVPEFADVRRAEAQSVIASALGSMGTPDAESGSPAASRWLLPDEVAQLLSCYGIPMAEWRLASSPEEAGRAAEAIGGRVALKGVAPGLIHKTEARAVVLDLEGAAQVEAEARAMAARIGQTGTTVERYFVQRMVRPGGVEMLVGVVHDPLFGPVVACGAGGVNVEVLKDVKVRITPLTDTDAHEMVTSLKTYPLLDGFRGAPRCDVAKLEEILLRVGAMVEDIPEIAEMDCNPVIVLPEGAMLVDARIRLEGAAGI
jgi:acetyl coenzyme A synthetase (ADP forming)-like protein